MFYIIYSSKLAVFLEHRSRKTDLFSEKKISPTNIRAYFRVNWELLLCMLWPDTVSPPEGATNKWQPFLAVPTSQRIRIVFSMYCLAVSFILMYNLTSSLFFLIQGLGFTTTVVTTPATTTTPKPIPTTTPKPTVSQQKCLGTSNYCPGQYGALKAVCKGGYCFCTGQDYDYNTCLRKLVYPCNKPGA